MKRALFRGIVAIPGILAGMLSCAACPMCLPLYATLITFLGVNTTDANVYLTLIMYSSLLTSLWLMFTATRRNNSGWFVFVTAFVFAGTIIFARVTCNTWVLYASLFGYFSLFFSSKYARRGGKATH